MKKGINDFQLGDTRGLEKEIIHNFKQEKQIETPESLLRKSIKQYGRIILDDKQQIDLLYNILDDAKCKLKQNDAILQLIHHYQQKLKREEDLQAAIKTVNKFIIDLEAKDTDKTTVNYLRQRGLYRILYRNSKLKGEQLPANNILNKLLRFGFAGIFLSGLLILFFIATAVFAAPAWLSAIATGLFVGASAYLSGMLYGVINDLFAAKSNLPYFLLGHQPQQKSLLRTNNKTAQGIAWGVAATFGPVVLAAVVFTVGATITAFFVSVATYILPLMLIGMALIAIGAEFYARRKARQYVRDNGYYSIGSNSYQSKGLDFMSPTIQERAAWFANSDRNMFGFTKVPIIGLVGLVALLVLSGVSMFLPVALVASPLLVVVIPAAFSAVAFITLAIAGGYMYKNRNKQVDDRYRLEFERENIEPNLYLEEDIDYINELADTYTPQSNSENNETMVEQKQYRSIFDRQAPEQKRENTEKMNIAAHCYDKQRF